MSMVIERASRSVQRLSMVLIRALKIDELRPIEALQLLSDLQKELGRR